MNESLLHRGCMSGKSTSKLLSEQAKPDCQKHRHRASDYLVMRRITQALSFPVQELCFCEIKQTPIDCRQPAELPHSTPLLEAALIFQCRNTRQWPHARFSKASLFSLLYFGDTTITPAQPPFNSITPFPYSRCCCSSSCPLACFPQSPLRLCTLSSSPSLFNLVVVVLQKWALLTTSNHQEPSCPGWST